jgi:dihydropyrimidinase
MHELAVRGGRVVTPEGVRSVDVGIDGGAIAAIGEGLRAQREIDASGCYVLPGVIDAHTHFQLPVGGTRSSDGFAEGSRAAACGGVTCIVDFTLGGQGRALPEAIEARRAEAEPLAIDYSLHGEIVGKIPSADAFATAIELGVRTFKFYLTYSRSGRMTDDAGLLLAFRRLAARGGRAMVHAENDAVINALTDALLATGRTDIAALAESRPAICEEEAILRAAVWARDAGLPLRIAHLTSALGLRAVRAARAWGTAIVAETCPQYLVLDAHAYEGADGPQFAATPPLRGPADREALWSAVADDGIEMIATDHCPFLRTEKENAASFADLPKGLPGVETLLPVVFSEGVSRQRISVERCAQLLSSGPARVLGLDATKGAIRVGADADLVLVDPARETTVHAESLHMNTGFSPYEGMRLLGAPVMTILRGRILVEEGRFCGPEDGGRFVPQTA